jgi:hypothetical protein
VRADIGFGWIVFVGFLLWVLQVLRAGGRGERGAGAAAPRPHRPDATQREGEQLEELLRQLQGRLGRPEARTPGKTNVLVKRPAPARQQEAVSLEAPVDREADAERIEQRRLAAVEARNRELGDTDHAAFEARIRTEGGPAAVAARRLTSGELRDAFVWTEILGQPVAFRE